MKASKPDQFWIQRIVPSEGYNSTKGLNEGFFLIPRFLYNSTSVEVKKEKTII